MLIRITNSCNMGCSHCMVEATPDGDHMSTQTFIDAIDFSVKYDPYLIFISGGEPTNHPHFLTLLKHAKVYQDYGKVATVLVASNGMFLEDEIYTKEILKIGIPFQITNDPNYYPYEIKKVEHKLLTYENTIRLLTPIGRAATNNLPTKRQGPLCFNLRSFCKNHNSFNLAVGHLRSMIKMCTPSINTDGSVVAGEAPSCYKIGTVKSTNEELTHNLNNMKCGKCGLYKTLEGKFAAHWNDMEQNYGMLE